MSARIAICDYGMGNLRSVEKALERVGARPEITRDAAVIAEADGVVLPGVGAFPAAMANLRDLGFEPVLRARVEAGRPVLGICLGFQLLFDGSTELGGAEGLGLLPGSVEPLEAPGLKIPHIGWAHAALTRESALMEGLGPAPAFYFVHSFAPSPAAEGDLLATAVYGRAFACAVEHGSLAGVQFHPEKSGAAGLRLLSNFNSVCGTAGVPV